MIYVDSRLASPLPGGEEKSESYILIFKEIQWLMDLERCAVMSRLHIGSTAVLSTAVEAVDESEHQSSHVRALAQRFKIIVIGLRRSGLSMGLPSCFLLSRSFCTLVSIINAVEGSRLLLHDT
jgi:hypothetical protein